MSQRGSNHEERNAQMDRSDHRLHRHSPADGFRNDLLCRSLLNKVKPCQASCLAGFLLYISNLSLIKVLRQNTGKYYPWRYHQSRVQV